MRNVFAKWDVNNDGKISEREFLSVLRGQVAVCFFVDHFLVFFFHFHIHDFSFFIRSFLFLLFSLGVFNAFKKEHR